MQDVLAVWRMSHENHELQLAKAGALEPAGSRIISYRSGVRRSTHPRRQDMNWQTPAYCEIRLGFEVTAYVYVR